MKCASTLGGPQILLPTRDVGRWIDELGEGTPSPDSGLYGLACSIDDYCGIISPWGTPLLIFGDEPTDTYWFPNLGNGVFGRWIAASGFRGFANFVEQQSQTTAWPESIIWSAQDKDFTLIDSCATRADAKSQMRISLQPGKKRVYSRYANDGENMCILHRLENLD